jgi:beta-lactamase class C
LPKFLRILQNWKLDESHVPGRDYRYSHSGILLLHLALELRFGLPYHELLERRVLRPLDLSSTVLPLRGPNLVGRFAPALGRRAVQGYSWDGKPIGKPGNVQGYYHWPGTTQMFSSARDMAIFLMAQMGELEVDPVLRDAIQLAHQEVASTDREPHIRQAQAWEVHHRAATIVDKNGGLENTTSYIGFIPGKRLGIVILINRGRLNGRDFGHPILLRLALPDSSAL